MPSAHLMQYRCLRYLFNLYPHALSPEVTVRPAANGRVHLTAKLPNFERGLLSGHLPAYCRYASDVRSSQSRPPQPGVRTLSAAYEQVSAGRATTWRFEGSHVCGLGEDSRMCARSRTRYVYCYDCLRAPLSRTRRISVYVRNRTLQQVAAVRRIQEKPLVSVSLLVLARAHGSCAYCSSSK